MTAHGKRAVLLVHEQDPFNAESTAPALAEADLTALDVFYVRSHGPVPAPEPAAWRLGVDGLVERELELNLDQLRSRFQEHEIVATLQCAGNRRKGLIAVRDIPGEAPWGPGATGTAAWRGVRLADVLEAAGIEAEAEYVAFHGADTSQEADPPQRFGASIPRHKALAPEVLLAWEMNGDPLPSVHGAPLRVVVPGYIGARSVKWVQRITAQAQPSENYFQAQTYRLLPAHADPKSAPPGAGVALGAVALNADILQPEEWGIGRCRCGRGERVRLRRRRPPHRARRHINRRRTKLDASRLARRSRPVGLAALANPSSCHSWPSRDRGARLGQLRRHPT